MIRIYYFAALKDVVGMSEEKLELEDCTVHALKEHLVKRYPALAAATYFVAVNEEYATEDDQIHSGDVVALIPPVSGG
ncbi:molybdopterin converting factor subunit 1 [Paenibacillus sp. 1001270B_150601_E10]|uniref:molybdopterin converting factor subunit 1 n=1 Tax=Paenibacillus sp. 1001270B_150601_E10 TaxID=2787079 RepID=UPI00189D3BA6|nr:molybdopterin converting factor subunit 1 [Paenibacillus sp. 1001270B_150601_E10]